MTQTVKKHDQPYLDLKIGEDLPNKTYIDTSTSKSKIMTLTVKNMIDHT